MKKTFKKLLSVMLIITLLLSLAAGAAFSASAASATGVGLSEYCLRAYREGWQYVYGGISPPYVDCSGLIMSYYGVGGSRTEMYYVASEKGSISTLPRIHGLGLYQPGHVGVYIGSGMAVDARDEYSDVVLQSVYKKNWYYWFKIVGVQYPTTGWVNFDGSDFYYEDGQYVVNTSRTLNGVTYTFGEDGRVLNAINANGENVSVNVDSNAGYSKPTSSNNSTVNNTVPDTSAQEAEAARLAEEQRKEQEKLEAEQKAAREKAARESAAAGYLTSLAAEDPFGQPEPETQTMVADESVLGQRTELTDSGAVLATEEQLPESETTVVLKQSLTKDGTLNMQTTENKNTGNPLAFILIVFSVLAGAGAFVLIEHRLSGGRRRSHYAMSHASYARSSSPYGRVKRSRH